MSFISPLKLLDPQDASFVPHGVRSLHDIIRFAHEKAVQEMFHIGEKRIRKIGGAKKLLSEIPMLFYVVDVGGGLRQDLADNKTVMIDDILSIPMKAVFRGLNHPEIHWSQLTHFDWAEYDKIVMSGGIISAESAMFASYAVLSHDYLNLNLRFGYHFVILDVTCGDKAEDNYILFRFSGGGADIAKRMLRADFLNGILDRLGFKVDMKIDLVDGELKGGEKKSIEQTLDIIGRLLGATRLMDMYLRDSSMVECYVEEFMNGRYHFATVEA
jgi:pyruvate,water dikinase